MKYIISENRIEELIIKYLDTMYPEITAEFGEELVFDSESGIRREENECHITFLMNKIGDYESSEVFDYFNICWFEGDSDHRYLLNQAPLLIVRDKKGSSILNSYFGDVWKESIKKWFVQKFGLEVKTVKVK